MRMRHYLAVCISVLALSTVITVPADHAAGDLQRRNQDVFASRLPGVIYTVTPRGQAAHCAAGKPYVHCTLFDDPRYIAMRGVHLKNGRYFYAVLTRGSEKCLKDSCRTNLSGPISSYRKRIVHVFHGTLPPTRIRPFRARPRSATGIRSFSVDALKLLRYDLALCLLGPRGSPATEKPSNCKVTTFSDEPQVTLCHATHSASNPYVQETVDAAGAYDGHYLQHPDDIIPPFVYNGQTYSLNWGPTGQAIWNNGCQVPSPTDTPTPVPTETPTPTPTNTAVPTDTPTPTATNTPIPTNTPVPTGTEAPELSTPLPTSTGTLVPTATNTPVLTATDTPVPTATDTPVPTATDTPVPTDTPIPTATNTSVPTDTPTPTATNTPVPTGTEAPELSTPLPTATNTPVPTPSGTPVPTNTPAPGQPTPLPTSTGTPVPTATNTPVPTASATAVATATNTPVPTPTGVPVPTPTSTSVVGHPTPPPPPTFVPTPIGPPPGPPTFTPTPAPPTLTPTPTATTPPLGAPARILATVRVQRHGRIATIRWRMAYQLGIKGFRIYAGHRQLTRSMIHPHHSPTYTAHVPWVRGGSYVLQVLYKNGHSQRFPIR